MTDRLLLVDLENIQTIDLPKVPSDARVMVFYGTTQKRLPEDLVVQAQPLGTRLQWLKIAGQGKNALDFHIAFYLGQELAANPSLLCLVLSADTGFDPLIRHLQSRGHSCRRVSSLKGAWAAEAPDDQDAEFARLLSLLHKEKARPARRKGLEGKVKSWFATHSEEARRALISRLFDESRVRESAGRLTYEL